VDQDLLEEIMASVGVFKHGVLKIFAHNRSNSELIQLLDQMLACGYLIGCTFEEHAQLCVESSSNEVLGRVVANNWNMLLKLIVFLDLEDLECGSYHISQSAYCFAEGPHSSSLLEEDSAPTSFGLAKEWASLCTVCFSEQLQ
jgi:hypothetical protein